MNRLLLLLPALLLVGACAAPAPAGPPRLLLLGVDGATWDVLDVMFEAGALPNWAGLAAQGGWGELRTFQPTSSPLIWTSIATGRTPTEHGIDDFVRRIPGTDRLIPMNSSFRTAEPVWSIFSRLDRSVIQVKWWASWPAEPVKGANLSSRLEHDVTGGHTYPANLFAQVDSFRDREYDPGRPAGRARPAASAPVPILGGRFKGGEAAKGSIPLLGKPPDIFDDVTVARAGEYVLAKYQPELFALYLKSVDKVEHFRWDYRDWRQHPEDPDYVRAGRQIDGAYEQFDQVLGRLRSVVGDDAGILVCSDHGMSSAREVARPFTLRDIDGDRLLEAMGFLTRREDGGVDWAHSRAYCRHRRPYDSELEISLNLAGREPQGSVPVEQRQAETAALAVAFQNLRLRSGQRLLTVRPGEEPVELVLSLPPEKDVSAELLLPGGPRPLMELLARPGLPQGIHPNAPPGVVLAAGGPFARAGRIEAMNVMDILPTLMAAADLPIARDWTGKVGSWLLSPDHLRRHPLRWIESYQSDRQERPQLLVTEDGDERLTEELRALGYIR